jgi:hypothetical protein
MNTSLANLSAAQLRRAAALKDRIQSLEKDLGKLLGAAAEDKSAPVRRKRKHMSKAARALISAAQKARWAKLKGPAEKPAPIRKKRKQMSKAARALISAAQKARWAKLKAAKK